MEKVYIEERAQMLARYIITTKDTVRGAAKKYGVSKSTVHKDIAERLLKINPSLAKEVKSVLEENKAERHIRGGEATRLKYANQKGTPFFGSSTSTATRLSASQRGHPLKNLLPADEFHHGENLT